MSRTIFKPFGPSILKVKMPDELIKKLNEYTDKKSKDTLEGSKLDAGSDLAGNVTQEIYLDEKFMKETHYIDGSVEPIILCYAILKSPELNNPLDPNSGETGNTLYGITEIYNGPEGAEAHMNLGQQRESMFSELVALTNEYCVCGILGAPVIRAME